MRFSWNQKKAEANLKKHGVSFLEAQSAFDDDYFVAFVDPDHSLEENRFLLLGQSDRGRLLVVSYMERNELIRIISTREATRRERKIYEEEI
jgi:uncharacterized DUF497 family protein